MGEKYTDQQITCKWELTRSTLNLYFSEAEGTRDLRKLKKIDFTAGNRAGI